MHCIALIVPIRIYVRLRRLHSLLTDSCRLRGRRVMAPRFGSASTRYSVRCANQPGFDFRCFELSRSYEASTV